VDTGFCGQCALNLRAARFPAADRHPLGPKARRRPAQRSPIRAGGPGSDVR